jgi:hypothetical protein
MELPKPRTANLMTYFAQVAKQSQPMGANQHSDRISRCWKHEKPRRPAGVCFNMSGPCQGDLSEVVGLALKLVGEALAKGDKEVAKAILDRIKVVHGEYAVVEVQARLARLQVQLAKAGSR